MYPFICTLLSYPLGREGSCSKTNTTRADVFSLSAVYKHKIKWLCLWSSDRLCLSGPWWLLHGWFFSGFTQPQEDCHLTQIVISGQPAHEEPQKTDVSISYAFSLNNYIFIFSFHVQVQQSHCNCFTLFICVTKNISLETAFCSHLIFVSYINPVSNFTVNL